MIVIISGLTLIILGILSLIFKRDRFEEGYVVFGIFGLITFIFSLAEFTQKEDEFERWKEDRLYLEITLLSVDKVKSSEQLLAIYEKIKDSNDDLRDHTEGLIKHNIFTEFHDDRFLRYEPISILIDENNTHDIGSIIREEKINEKSSKQ